MMALLEIYVHTSQMQFQQKLEGQLESRAQPLCEAGSMSRCSQHPFGSEPECACTLSIPKTNDSWPLKDSPEARRIRNFSHPD